MRVNGKIPKCAISWKPLDVERNAWKFGTYGARNCICFHPILTKLYEKYGNQCRLVPFSAICQIWKFYGTFKFLLTQNQMGLEISKCYSYSFHPISVKRYEGIDYHDGIQAITFLGKRLIVERNGWKFVARGPRNLICRYVQISEFILGVIRYTLLNVWC